MEVCRGGIEQVRLGAAVHHMDKRALTRRMAGQDRLAIEMIEVLGDRRTFGDVNAVFEFEHRDCAGRNSGEKFGALVLAGRYVDGNELDRMGQPFLGERDAYAAGLGKPLSVDSHHARSFFLPFQLKLPTSW